MNLLQLRFEVKEARDIVNSLTLISESDGDNIAFKDAQGAFKLLDDEYKVTKADYVQSKISYKNVEVCLHESDNGTKSLKMIINE